MEKSDTDIDTSTVVRGTDPPSNKDSDESKHQDNEDAVQEVSREDQAPEETVEPAKAEKVPAQGDPAQLALPRDVHALSQAVAVPNDEDEDPIEGKAQPVDRQERKQQREQTQQRQRTYLRAFLVLIGVAIVFAVVTIGIRIARSNKKIHTDKSTESTLAPVVSENSSLAPVLSENSNSTWAVAVSKNSKLTNSTLASVVSKNSTLAPVVSQNSTLAPVVSQNVTLAPVVSQNSTLPKGILDDFVATLPNLTIQSLLDPLSAPTAAYNWLVQHPDVATMDNSRKSQLFGLATLYFASLKDGPSFLQNGWMKYDRNECYWFSSADLRNQQGDTACNEQGQFIRLDLAGLGFATAETFKIPREIRLLSNLQHFWWPNARIPTVALARFLPPVFFQLPNLESILLNGNDFTGTIPTQFGLLTKLRVLDLSNNELTGSIPTELAQLSSLEYLFLWINHLTGTIPTGWDNLKQLFVYRNQQITGVVPETLCGLNQENCFFNPATVDVYRMEKGACDVRFDCSGSLCGCDCPCPSM